MSKYVWTEEFFVEGIGPSIDSTPQQVNYIPPKPPKRERLSAGVIALAIGVLATTAFGILLFGGLIAYVILHRILLGG